jgi:hypothetical protein
LAYKKQTLPLVSWSKKYLSVNYCDFLTPTVTVTENAHVNIWPLRNITNPTGFGQCQNVLKTLKAFLLFS